MLHRQAGAAVGMGCGGGLRDARSRIWYVFIVVPYFGSFSTWLEKIAVLKAIFLLCRETRRARESPAPWFIVSQNHRKAWVEGTSKPTQSHSVGCPPPAQAAQGPIQPGLECLQGWGSRSWETCLWCSGRRGSLQGPPHIALATVLSLTAGSTQG